VNKLDRPAAAEGDVNHSPRRRAWAADNITGPTRALIDRDSRAFLHQSVSTPCLNAIARAEGIWIEDVAGRRYMDFHGNNVHHIGYGHPRLKAAIAAQMDALPFAPRRFTCEPAVLLAEKLGRIAPGGLSKTLFTTGAEHVAPFACYRCPYGYPDRDGGPDLDLCRMACASYLRYVLEREGDIAAVIAEPARAVPFLPPPGYWRAVAEECAKHGALLIFDEIPTGLGKTGRMFACEHDGVTPDILVLGKALGGGILPIAAVLCRPELDVAGAYAFGHYTHEKNPVTARAALTTIEIIEDEDLAENARRVGEAALDRLLSMKARHPLIGDVRGRGLLLGVDLVTDRRTKAPAADAAEAVLYRAMDAGLSFKTTMGNVLTLTPPLVVTEAQMMAALDILDEAIGAEERALGLGS
jgi:4-aminobutyrate aminotransferase